MTHTSHSRRRMRLLARGAAIVALAGAASCTEFLRADNPGAIEEQDVNNPAYVNLLANGPIGQFQDALDDVVYWNAQLTDELVNRAVFAEEGDIDRRDLYPAMTYIPAFIYSPMQRARFVAEDAVVRMVAILGSSAAGADIRAARAQAYAGHSYIVLGETMCTTPVNLGPAKSPQQIFADAVRKLDSAATMAAAAKAALGPPTTANAAAIAATDSVRLFALVGAARASLNRNDKATAITYAQQVLAANPNFAFFAYYSDNTAQQRNRTYERLQLGSNAYLRYTPFEAMDGDPRVPRIPGTTGRAWTPLSPSSYSTFNNTVAGAQFGAVMTMRIASALEARYIIAEAEGPTAATLAFVNTRRAAGNQAPVALAGDALMAELRDQRSRDFYLDGHRLGDLRRYKEYYGVDLFPSGPYPPSTTGAQYGPATCWPLPTSEINGNPNLEG